MEGGFGVVLDVAANICAVGVGESGGALDVVCTRVVLVHESLMVFNNVVVMHPIMAGHYCVFVSVSVCLNVCELCFFS